MRMLNCPSRSPRRTSSLWEGGNKRSASASAAITLCSLIRARRWILTGQRRTVRPLKSCCVLLSLNRFTVSDNNASRYQSKEIANVNQLHFFQPMRKLLRNALPDAQPFGCRYAFAEWQSLKHSIAQRGYALFSRSENSIKPSNPFSAKTRRTRCAGFSLRSSRCHRGASMPSSP